jgi:hypothetical protein
MKVNFVFLEKKQDEKVFSSKVLPFSVVLHKE